jgi:hypothetical protein
MTPGRGPDPFQVEVARITLAATAHHGFALAGGQALIAYGVVDRPTEDVDLFTDEDGGVRAALPPAVDALRRAGFAVGEVPETTELGAVFEGFDSDVAELEVSRGPQTVRVQLARFDRDHEPVAMPVGPVLDLDDVVATKIAALGTRAYPRDYVDVAGLLTRYDRDRLVALGRLADPALTDDELAEAMQRLDRLDDSVFALYGLTPDQVDAVRSRFADWPRD